MMRPASRQRGMTIIELVVTIVIFSIALTSVAAMVGRGVGESADTLAEVRAIALGQAYLNEISSRRFDEGSSATGLSPCFGLASEGVFSKPCTEETDFGPDGGENSRTRFDDVDDYHGLVEGFDTPVPLQDAEGLPRSGYENYRVEVNVTYAGDDFGFADRTHAKLIVVSVALAGQSEPWRFSVHKVNF